ncbi:MAG: hypothetical protein K0S98_969, partial [Propionibacteriaceae bacterium]|nr:hypothetical protein [Propionibacteriaceae bacterium]
VMSQDIGIARTYAS